MSEYMICRITMKNRLEIISVVGRQEYEQLTETLKLAVDHKANIRKMPGATHEEVEERDKRWKEMNDEVKKLYPQMDINPLLAKYEHAIILDHFKLLRP